MFTKAKKPAEPDLNINLLTHKPYADWSAKVAEIADKERAADREESSLLEKLATRTAAPEVTANVANLLGDDVGESDAPADGLQMRLRAVQSERRDLRSARKIAEERKQKARHEASRIICAEIEPEYKKRVSALADALLAAHSANVKLAELTDALEVSDTAWTSLLRPAPATRILGEHGSRVALWLKDAAEYGIVDHQIIPQDLQS